jgi:hypothetical protein
MIFLTGEAVASIGQKAGPLKRKQNIAASDAASRCVSHLADLRADFLATARWKQKRRSRENNADGSAITEPSSNAAASAGDTDVLHGYAVSPVATTRLLDAVFGRKESHGLFPPSETPRSFQVRSFIATGCLWGALSRERSLKNLLCRFLGQMTGSLQTLPEFAAV